jgi:hypothetical protein
MTTFRIVALSTGVTLAAGIAMASTPFGGDDGGFIPSNKLTLTCESGIAKAVGKAAACIGKCHAGRSSGKLADDTAENACESNNAGKSCLEKFLASAAKAQSHDTTGGCGCINPKVLADQLELQLDEIIPLVYCDQTSGTLFGGDDSIVSPFGSAGFLPVANSAVAKCEDRANQLVGKAIACILTCHNKRASGKLADDTAEDTCEGGARLQAGCLLMFEDRVLQQPGCPSCLVQVSLGGEPIESSADTLAGFIYCASPSGAFLP